MDANAEAFAAAADAAETFWPDSDFDPNNFVWQDEFDDEGLFGAAGAPNGLDMGGEDSVNVQEVNGQELVGEDAGPAVDEDSVEAATILSNMANDNGGGGEVEDNASSSRQGRVNIGGIGSTALSQDGGRSSSEDGTNTGHMANRSTSGYDFASRSATSGAPPMPTIPAQYDVMGQQQDAGLGDNGMAAYSNSNSHAGPFPNMPSQVFPPPMHPYGQQLDTPTSQGPSMPTIPAHRNMMEQEQGFMHNNGSNGFMGHAQDLAYNSFSPINGGYPTMPSFNVGHGLQNSRSTDSMHSMASTVSSTSTVSAASSATLGSTYIRDDTPIHISDYAGDHGAFLPDQSGIDMRAPPRPDPIRTTRSLAAIGNNALDGSVHPYGLRARQPDLGPIRVKARKTKNALLRASPSVPQLGQDRSSPYPTAPRTRTPVLPSQTGDYGNAPAGYGMGMSMGEFDAHLRETASSSPLAAFRGQTFAQRMNQQRQASSNLAASSSPAIAIPSSPPVINRSAAGSSGVAFGQPSYPQHSVTHRNHLERVPSSPLMRVSGALSSSSPWVAHAARGHSNDAAYGYGSSSTPSGYVTAPETMAASSDNYPSSPPALPQLRPLMPMPMPGQANQAPDRIDQAPARPRSRPSTTKRGRGTSQKAKTSSRASSGTHSSSSPHPSASTTNGDAASEGHQWVNYNPADLRRMIYIKRDVTTGDVQREMDWMEEQKLNENE